MKYIKEWFGNQWKEKKFRLFFLFTLFLMIALGIEFYLFKYGIMKCLRYFVVLWGMFVISWIDSKEKRIPNKILIWMLIIRAAILCVEGVLYKEYWMSIAISAIGGFLIAGGMFLFCYIITKGGIGAGDVKLFSVLGLYTGSGAIFSVIFLTVLFAAVYNSINLLRKKTDLKQEIPFAPFIFWGSVVAMLLGM